MYTIRKVLEGLVDVLRTILNVSPYNARTCTSNLRLQTAWHTWDLVFYPLDHFPIFKRQDIYITTYVNSIDVQLINMAGCVLMCTFPNHWESCL